MGYRNTNSKILRFASSWGTQTQNILLFTFIFPCHNDMWLSKIPGNLQYWGIYIGLISIFIVMSLYIMSQACLDEVLISVRFSERKKK